ncbi:Trafficking protein particle complex subunit 3 [Harpegnathos saltator]|uniref:Trafficking protein particle complex subunit 3 n=1 Tax=Harpegnathos saltator TaxID=610380 RepID=E2BKP8_HARSA|nr:Trafficking protein particle complex subunit 3 [Harpegnathos saltator]
MSARILRFKQLQNQLADAHYHLNELANENRLLKALQKRQDSALRRYEGTNAELPRIINSHHEELRVLQTKYKKLKELHRDTCNLLKEKENELYTVNSQNKHLLQLSKDRNLGEREKLQLQISDMNHEMQQQQETIQLLHRKLALETKSMKHQLHIEISKHKETQKNLQETIEKLKTLECLLDNREKRLYYNGQLPIYNKEKNLDSHSFTNLSDIRLINGIDDTSDTLDDIKKVDIHYSDGEEKKELSTRLVKDLAFQKFNYKSKSDILQHHRNKKFDDSDSEVDSEEKIDRNEEYFSTEYEADVTKYSKEQFSKSCNDTTHLGYNTSEIKEPFELKNTKLQMISNDTLDDIYSQDIEVSAQISEKKLKNRPEELSENNDVDNSFTDIRKEEYKKEKKEYLEKEPVYTDISYNNVYKDMFKQNNTNEEINNLLSPEKEVQDNLQQAHEEYKTKTLTEYIKTEDFRAICNEDKAVLHHPEENDYSMDNLIKEYHRLRVEETPRTRNYNDEEETLKEDDFNVETNNRLNALSEAENINALSNIVQASHHAKQANEIGDEIIDVKHTTDTKKKLINYNKEKLLATMKAIDDNENIEFLNQEFKNHNVNSELFTLTYGALVAQLLKDYENVEDVNKQLERMGYNMGIRLIEDFLARTGSGRCYDFRDTAEKIQSGFKIFLGITPTITNWSPAGDEFSLSFETNPLTEFVELPDHCLNLKYCNILTGILRGACEMVQMEIACWFVQDQLKNDNVTELRVKFVKRLEDAIPAGED